MAFHEVRFPADISYGSSGGPEYSTDIIITSSGYEQRNINWEQARARYNVAHGVKTEGQLAELLAFFRARRGRAYGFRFKDWADYRASAQNIGSGNGAQKSFQLIKNYVSSVTVTRKISKPVTASVKIYKNGALQLTGYSIDHTTGIVNFASAPANLVAITADFEFDVPVRFDTDKLSARMESYGVSSWNDIPLVEVRV